MVLMEVNVDSKIIMATATALREQNNNNLLYVAPALSASNVLRDGECMLTIVLLLSPLCCCSRVGIIYLHIDDVIQYIESFFSFLVRRRGKVERRERLANEDTPRPISYCSNRVGDNIQG